MEGRIVTPDGAPVAGAEVALDSLDIVGRSGADGRFRLEEVPAGRRTLVVRAPGRPGRRVVVRVPEGVVVRLDVEIGTAEERAPPADLSGVVRDGSTLAPPVDGVSGVFGAATPRTFVLVVRP